MRRNVQIIFVLLLLLVPVAAQQQPDPSLLTVDSIFTYRTRSLGPVRWAETGGYYALEPSPTKRSFVDIVHYDVATGNRTVVVSAEQLTPPGASEPLLVEEFAFTERGTGVLIFTKSQRVWRSNTRGDYWICHIGQSFAPGKAIPLIALRKLGGPDAKPSSLMFAKISPDGLKAAYVRENNIYVEDLINNKITKLTTDGTRYIVNGTFDWVYEEELFCRDGFRWSPDSKQIA
ncbi:MAG TPA: DPP IV N-terminal domain-containing protein, partial [Pyrinomonadaceae bacterium]|nr:DPP IV N-terminal domain-containing protein [Pyrinomonadaceae bacterium]